MLVYWRVSDVTPRRSGSLSLPAKSKISIELLFMTGEQNDCFLIKSNNVSYA